VSYHFSYFVSKYNVVNIRGMAMYCNMLCYSATANKRDNLNNVNGIWLIARHCVFINLVQFNVNRGSQTLICP